MWQCWGGGGVGLGADVLHTATVTPCRSVTGGGGTC